MLTSLFQSTTDPGAGDFSLKELRDAAGKLPRELREPAARYLRHSKMILAWMESTEDLLEGRFRVAGGSAVNSDGTFYWRLDTADYVEQYGIALPRRFLDHASSLKWTPPLIDDLQFFEIYGELEHVMQSYRRPAQTPLQTFYPDLDPQ